MFFHVFLDNLIQHMSNFLLKDYIFISQNVELQKTRFSPIICQDGTLRPSHGQCLNEAPVFQTKNFPYAKINRKKTSNFLSKKISATSLNQPKRRKHTSTLVNALVKSPRFEISDDELAENILNSVDISTYLLRLVLDTYDVAKIFLLKKFDDETTIFNADEILYLVDIINIINNKETSFELAKNILYTMKQFKKWENKNKSFWPYGSKTRFNKVYRLFHNFILKNKDS